jgi:NADH-quinone oxidoreductase subunit G
MQTVFVVRVSVGTRPAWKVLRVLGNLLDADGFEYVSSEDVRDEFAAAVVEPDTATPL